jgi:diguanylate cyclase (GGDEF)-like protein
MESITPYSLLALSTTLLSLPVAIIAWRQRAAPGGLPLALLMAATGEWAFGATCEYATTSLDAKILWSVFQYAGSLSAPVFFLWFSLQYNGLSRWTWRRIRWLFLVPLLCFALAATNHWHHLIWTSFTSSAVGQNLIVYGHGIAFWVGVIGYSYVLMALATLLLLLPYFRISPLDHPQTRLLLLAALAPWAANVFYLLPVNPLPGLDWTPLSLVFTGAILGLAMLRFRLLNLLPLARATLLERMPNGVIVLDEQKRLLDMNPAAQTFFHIPRHRLFEPAALILPHWEQLADAFSPEHESRVRLPPHWEIDISPFRRENGTFAGWILLIRDIEAQYRAKQALQRRDAILQAVGRAAQEFLNPTAECLNFSAALESLGSATGVSRVYIFERFLNEEGTPLVSQRYEWVSAGVTPQIDNPDLQNLPYCQAGFQRWEDELSQGRFIVGLVKDFPPAERDFLRLQDILSIAVVPIFKGKSFWGFVGFDECREERPWSPAELEALKIAADLIGSALEWHEAEQHLREHHRALELTRDILQLALQAGDLVEMAQLLVDRVGSLIGADGCFITLWDENQRLTLPLAAYGPFRDSYRPTKTLPGEKTFTASVLEAGHPLVIEDTHHSPYASKRIPKMFPSRSMLALPLLADGKKLGAILLSFDEQHSFRPEEIAVAEQAANLIALAVAKLQAIEEARRRAEEAETLRRAGAAVTISLDIERTVDLILKELARVVPYDSASVQLLRPGFLEIVGGRGWKNPKEVLGLRFSVPGDNPNTLVVEKQQPVLLSTTEQYPTFHQPPHRDIRSWLGVPLMVRDKVIGILAIDSVHPHHFSEAHMKLATAFADHVAIALDNARLFAETQELALTDPLTGLYNRRGFSEIGHIEFGRARRLQRPCSLLMIDIDHFKRINDRYGHAEGGDVVLQALGKYLKDNTREIDLVCRYGGEEFVVLLPDVDPPLALEIGERLREGIANLKVQINSHEIAFTVSVGVATCNHATTTLEILLARADQAMYIAKHRGRNRVVVSH